MSRKLVILTLFPLGILCVVVAVQAQQRPPLLSERLQGLRDEILGVPAVSAPSGSVATPTPVAEPSAGASNYRWNAARKLNGQLGTTSSRNGQSTQSADNPLEALESLFNSATGASGRIRTPTLAPTQSVINNSARLGSPGTTARPQVIDNPHVPATAAPTTPAEPSTQLPQAVAPMEAVQAVPPTSSAASSLEDRLLAARASSRRTSVPVTPAESTAARPSPSGADAAAPRVAALPGARPWAGATASPPVIGSAAPARSTTVAPTNVHSALGSAASDPAVFSRQSPILSARTVGPKAITIGKQSTFTIAMANSGTRAANDVVVAVQVPEWCDVVGATASEGTTSAAGDSGNFQWRLGELAAGTQQKLQLSLIPRKSRPFDLAATWTFAPPSGGQLVEVKEPKLMLAISGPEEVIYGQTRLYRLTLSNPGTGDAENVVLNLMPIDQRQGRATNHRIGTLGAGENRMVEIELTARQAGNLKIAASATAETGLQAEAQQSVLVRRAELRVEASGSNTKYAGTATTYQVRVTNPGNAVAENVEVSALLPRGATYISSTGGGQLDTNRTKVTWKVSALQSEADQSFEIQCVLTAPGENRMQVLARADEDLTDSAAVTTQIEALADLKLEVKDPLGPVRVGETMVYEVRIFNRGTKAAEGIDVVGFFSDGVEPLGLIDQAVQHEISPGQIVFSPIGKIEAGGEAVLKVKARADKAGSHLFRAEVVCKTLGTKLVSEETTRFYGEATAASEPAEKTDRFSSATTSPAPLK